MKFGSIQEEDRNDHCESPTRMMPSRNASEKGPCSTPELPRYRKSPALSLAVLAFIKRVCAALVSCFQKIIITHIDSPISDFRVEPHRHFFRVNSYDRIHGLATTASTVQHPFLLIVRIDSARPTPPSVFGNPVSEHLVANII